MTWPGAVLSCEEMCTLAERSRTTRQPLFAGTEPLSTIPELQNSPNTELKRYYDLLFAAHGAQYWWPGRTRFEVIVGAILTQNTAWTNVETAIRKLRKARLLNPRAIESVPLPRLARLIRASGYFRQKARKLKAFAHFLRNAHGGSLKRMLRTPTAQLRAELLGIWGIGPETADSILLYAGGHPVFVIDAYTRRIVERHGLAGRQGTYEELRGIFEAQLPQDPSLYNEFHALIVYTGKTYCRARNPRCEECPLKTMLPKNTLAENRFSA